MSRVLIADDEEVIADSVAAILSRFGIESFAAYDGKAALQQAGISRPIFS